MSIQEAYKIVYEDMMNSGCHLLQGHYDAKNGNEKYMLGVNMVMEFIAYKVSDENGDKFSEMFYKNILDSQKKE